jgi:hypothetical protein
VYGEHAAAARPGESDAGSRVPGEPKTERAWSGAYMDGAERRSPLRSVSPRPSSLKTARYGANICASTASAEATLSRVILFSNRDLSTARS